MMKIGDKSSFLSPIMGFQTQNPFRKPSDSSPQGPATISNNSWMKASLRWRGSIKVGSIGLRSKHHSPIPNITINYVKHCLFRTIRLFKHLLQVGFVFSRCALAAIHGVNQIKVHFSVQMPFDFQIVKLLLQAQQRKMTNFFRLWLLVSFLCVFLHLI